MGRHSSGVFGRENLNFRVLAVRINFRYAWFFITIFCTSDQGWCSKCSSAYFGKCFIIFLFLFYFIYFSFFFGGGGMSGWHRIV